MHAILPLLQLTEFWALRCRTLETLQVNLGYRCNQDCLNCHVNARPNRKEMMDDKTVMLIPKVLKAGNIGNLDLDRAIADGSAHSFVKLLTVPDKNKTLIVTLVGEHAGDLLAEFVLAMKRGLNNILGTIHLYQMLARENKCAAGEWKRTHAPQRLLAWLERYHIWKRS